MPWLRDLCFAGAKVEVGNLEILQRLHPIFQLLLQPLEYCPEKLLLVFQPEMRIHVQLLQAKRIAGDITHKGS